MIAKSADVFNLPTRTLRAAFPVLLLVLTALPVSAQVVQQQKDSASVPEEQRPVADSHSFIELFTKLENQLTRAIQTRDRSGLESLLAPEFVVRNTEDPQHPVARDIWISHAIAGPEVESFNHNTMAIRAFMGVAVVSFAQEEQQKADSKDRTVRCFVVDVWEVDHQHWLVAERYISPVGSRP